MNYEILTGLMIFALVTTITPGPNTLMMMTSGINYGFRQSVPHMLGIGIGFTLMVIMVGIGLTQIFEAYPLGLQVLKVCSVSYLLYLAYRIATSTSPAKGSETTGKPFTFLEAALYQWVNPKAWTMALTAISVYSPSSRSLESVLLVAIIFGAIALPSVSLWAWLGENLRHFLRSEGHLRRFNIGMAVLLVASLYPAINGSA